MTKSKPAVALRDSIIEPWTVEKTLEINPRARLLKADHPEAVLLAFIADKIHVERECLATWYKLPVNQRGRSHPLHHDLESFFANSIDGLIDANVAGLSHRFNEFAQGVHDSQIRARDNPDAPAIPEYRTDNPTALHEYTSRLAELYAWCCERFDAIYRAHNDAMRSDADAIPATPPSTNSLEPLTPTEQAVFDLIPESPEAIQGPQIISTLRKRSVPLNQSTLTKHIIPNLKSKRGIRNRQGAGYYRPTE